MTDTSVDGVIDTHVDVAVDGARSSVHVRVEGPADAPVLLALHGFGGSLHWWGLVVPGLARAMRVVRMDLLGHGTTVGAAADAPVQARTVAAVLDRLDLREVTVAGHSFGADVAVALAEQYERIVRVVVVCQAPDYRDANLPRGAHLMAHAQVARRVQRVAVVAARAAVAVRNRRHPDAADRGLVEQAVRDLAGLDPAMFRTVLLERGERMARRPLDAQLRDAAKPTLVVLGGRDHYYGARSAGRYRAAGAHVVVLPTSDHSPLIEQPDRMVQVLLEFVPQA